MVLALRQEVVELARGERGAIIGSTPGDPRPDDLFIRDFLAVHMPHKISDLVQQAMSLAPIVSELRRLIGPDIKAVQTSLFVKAPGQAGQAWHQDESYLPTRDRSLCAAWIALDDATEENGCLWAHSGSHAKGIIYPARRHNDERFDGGSEAFAPSYPREGGVALPVAAGGVVFFNGYLLHRSLNNRAKHNFRRALVTHYMSAQSLLPWALNAREACPDLRDVTLVSGDDPYAQKGVVNFFPPYAMPTDAVRASDVYDRIKTARDARWREL